MIDRVNLVLGVSPFVNGLLDVYKADEFPSVAFVNLIFALTGREGFYTDCKRISLSVNLIFNIFYVQAEGILDNTYIFYNSDHGAYCSRSEVSCV